METLGFQAGEIPGVKLAPNFRFRRGQAEFLRRLAGGLTEGERNFLGVFVPGYGKTITALASFLVARALSVAQKLVVFVPRGNLRDQYADPRELASLMRSLGAPPLTFCVADSEKQFLRHLSTDVVITTYQYASGRGGSEALRQFCARSLCMFVFDEVHHLSHDGTWAAKIKEFPFSCSVALSGTPMRSDNKSLFGVPQEVREDEAGKLTQFYKPLHETLLRDAHAEGGVLKKVRAHVMDYAVTLRNTETGSELRLSLSELADCAQTPAEIDAFLTRKQLRFHEAYLNALLQPAFERFAEKRQEFADEARAGGGKEPMQRQSRNHQMLIIAMSNAHAAAILDFVRERFPEFVSDRIGQDIPARERARALKRYREGEIDVMAQVDMIGEGTDIKPISVIVKADLVRAMSKTMQQLFRGMRYYAPFRAEGNVCDVYASNDAEIVGILEWLVSEEQIGVSVREERSQRAPAQNGQFAPQRANKDSWELTGVEHEQTDSHGLELRNGALEHIALEWQDVKRGRGRPRSRPETMFVVDDERVRVEYAVTQAARERELRRECSELMMKLAQSLPKEASETHSSSFMFLHNASMQRFAKPKEQMNAEELARKREWLKQCIREKKVV